MTDMSSSEMFDEITKILNDRGNGMFHLRITTDDEDGQMYEASLSLDHDPNSVVTHAIGNTPALAVQRMLEDHEKRRRGES